MIPCITIKPISGNVIRVILSTGIVIEVSDSGESLGGDIHISENEERLRLGRFKRIQVIPKGADSSDTFRVEMKQGIGY
jgi:hypothetical protein